MEVARYATPYLARRSLADWPPSFFLRDCKSPASRPKDLVVSSGDESSLVDADADVDDGDDDEVFSLVSNTLRAV